MHAVLLVKKYIYIYIYIYIIYQTSPRITDRIIIKEEMSHTIMIYKKYGCVILSQWINNNKPKQYFFSDDMITFIKSTFGNRGYAAGSHPCSKCKGCNLYLGPKSTVATVACSFTNPEDLCKTQQYSKDFKDGLLPLAYSIVNLHNCHHI